MTSDTKGRAKDGKNKTIMFVDDEAHILAGVRTLLRRQRREWDMSFVNGGKEALEALKSKSFDVVVSDMRMPEVDGLQVLSFVKENHPSTVRIILSGFTERESALRLVPVAHQFLAKPCDAEVLRRTVRNACELHSMINSERLRDMVGQLSHLPSAPEMYNQVLEMTSRPDHNIRDLAELISQDSGLVAKLLKLVNSAFFGQARPTSDLSRAAMLLGVTTMRELVLGLQSAQQFDINRERCGIRLEAESRHGLAVGQLARAIALEEGLSTKEAGAAMTAGLLHAVGKLVIAVNNPEASKKLAKAAKEAKRTRAELEFEELGVTSAELGACLLAMWGIPYSIVEGVAYCGRPSEVAGEVFSVAGAVHIANVIVTDPRRELLILDREFAESRGLGTTRDAWLERYDALQEAA